MNNIELNIHNYSYNELLNIYKINDSYNEVKYKKKIEDTFEKVKNNFPKEII